MRYWFSPLPLPAALSRQLLQAGLQPWPAEQPGCPELPFLLLYNSPEHVVIAAAEASIPLTTQQLSTGYSQVVALAETSGQQPLAAWRLQMLEPEVLIQAVQGSTAHQPLDTAPASIEPGLAAMMLSLLELDPQLLDAYNDLELRAQLLGGEPDLHYRRRLLQALQLVDPMPRMLEMVGTPAAVATLEEQLQARECDLREAREEGELTLLQLHQVQEELEQIFLADRQKQQALETSTAELEALRSELEGLRQQLEPRIRELEEQVQARECDLREAREEAELTLLQLHQVQEELEQIFLADRQKQQALETSTAELEALRSQLEGLRQQLEPRIRELEEQVQARECDLREAREEAELTLLQLHQVQEELEHYFLLSRSQSDLLGQYGQQQLQVQKLLAQCVISSGQSGVSPRP